MANSLNINIQSGGLGRPLAGEDHISGMLFYSTATLPTGFTNSTRIKQVFSIEEAEALGIVTTLTGTSVLHYHIDQYFTAQPKGNLYVGVYSSDTTFDEVVTIQNYAEGKIRQLGVYTQSNFATSQVSALQTHANTCETNYKPLEILLQANFSTVSDLSTLSDLTALSGKYVSVLIGQDGGATGAALYTTFSKSIGILGLTLGAMSFAKVNESIAWVAKFNMSIGGEYETLAFANGTAYNTLSDSAINAVDAKSYVFLKKHIGLAGSYFDNPYTSVAVTSDFCRSNSNRTMHKATRGLRSFLLPALASPVKVNSDGTLTEDTIGYFQSLGDRALEAMVRDGEISAYSVVIDPTQDTLSTGQLDITVKIVPVGSADVIEVSIGFATSV